MGSLDAAAFSPGSFFDICFDELCATIAPTFGVTKYVIEKRLYYEELKGDFARRMLGENAASVDNVWSRGH